MGEFFANVTRYPRYLIAFGLRRYSVFEPLLARTRNPVTAAADRRLISGVLTLTLVLGMVTPVPPT